MDLPKIVVKDNGVLLSITARPNASRNTITGVHAGCLKLAITEAPEKGKANTAIIKLLAKALGIACKQIQLHSGATSTRKKLLISEMSVHDLLTRIESVLPMDT